MVSVVYFEVVISKNVDLKFDFKLIFGVVYLQMDDTIKEGNTNVSSVSNDEIVSPTTIPSSALISHPQKASS